MYKQHADKLISLLQDSDETIEQAFVLIDSLVDTLPEEEKSAFSKVFGGLSFEKGTFTWMKHHLSKMRSWQHRQFYEKGYFWRFVDFYLRAYPENIESLPTVLHLKYISEIPWFLKKPNPCRVVVLDDTSKSVMGLERCSTVSSVQFNMGEYAWRNLVISFDLTEIRNRTEEFAIIAPGFMAKWEMHEGVCELVVLKETTENGRHLQAYANRLSLTKYPLLQISNAWSSNFTADLWGHKTPYYEMEFGPLKLVLSEEEDRCIADRVQQISINQATRFNCVLEDVFDSVLFPNLQDIIILNTGTVQLNITRRILRNLPALTLLSVRGGESNVVWDQDVWEIEHSLKSLTADEFGMFHHHWEFSKEKGTLRERLRKMSVSFDWINNNVDLIKGVTHLNIFQSDVEWSFVKHLTNLQKLYVEGEQGEGDFDYHGIYFPYQCFFDPPKMSTGKAFTGITDLFQIVSRTDRTIYGVTLELLKKLRHMADVQRVPTYFKKWLREMEVVRISNSFAWMDGETFKYKAYSNMRADYKQQVENGLHKTLNLERLLAGLPEHSLHFDLQPCIEQCTSLRYNTNRLPLSTFQSPNIKEVSLETECDLTELSCFPGIEILSINNQSDWFTELPEEIGQLTMLRELYLWHNSLTALPDSIAQLQNLETINISGNGFTSVPEVLLSLPNLQTICLRGCHSFEGFESIQERIDEGTCTIHFVDAALHIDS